MNRIGIRLLKEQTGEILRRVREDGEVFEVTYRGRAVARIVPVTKSEHTRSVDEFLEDWEKLRRAVSANWPENVSAVDAVDDTRREL